MGEGEEGGRGRQRKRKMHLLRLSLWVESELGQAEKYRPDTKDFFSVIGLIKQTSDKITYLFCS